MLESKELCLLYFTQPSFVARNNNFFNYELSAFVCPAVQMRS